MDNEELLLTFLLLLTTYILHKRNQASGRRYWVHPMNQSREEDSVALRVDKLHEYPERFHAYFRMKPEGFQYILGAIHHRIKKIDTNMRKAIDPKTRLYVTLYYLATGASYQVIATHYALGRSTVSGIVQDTCQAIVDLLGPIYLRMPTSHLEWRNIADRFYELWDFPNCVGAVDGKHILMRAPDNSGSCYFNYKKTFSINLMAVADATYKFIGVDIGQLGSASDGGVWDRSNFGSGWSQDLINTPPARPLPGSNHETNFMLVGDEAFPLQPNLMRPYPGREARNNMPKRRYNYRLSRARRVIENAFGILTNRWRFLYTPVDASPNKLTTMVYAACILHNFLLSSKDDEYMPAGYGDVPRRDGELMDGLWRLDNALEGVGRLPGQNWAASAIETRLKLTEWFSEQGVREWQDQHILRTN